MFFVGVPVTLSKPVCSLRKEIPFKGTCGEFPLLSPILWGYSVRVNLASPQGRYMYLQLSTVMEFTFQVRRKLLTFSLSKLSTSSFISNFSECGLAEQFIVPPIFLSMNYPSSTWQSCFFVLILTINIFVQFGSVIFCGEAIGTYLFIQANLLQNFYRTKNTREAKCKSFIIRHNTL